MGRYIRKPPKRKRVPEPFIRCGRGILARIKGYPSTKKESVTLDDVVAFLKTYFSNN